MSRPSMGSEDFAYYLERVPGMMFRLGAAGNNGPWPGLHTPTFDVDEKCLAVGEKIFGRTVIEWSKASQEFVVRSPLQRSGTRGHNNEPRTNACPKSNSTTTTAQ